MEHHSYGAILSPYDERDYKAKEHIAMGVRPQSYYPKALAPVLNQGPIGSCMAHAMATMKWYQEYAERKGSFELSTDFFYHNRKPTDWQGDGMVGREACANLVSDGGVLRSKLPTNTAYPSSAVKALVDELKRSGTDFHGDRYVLCKTKDEICEAIYQYKAVIIIIPVYTSFNSFYHRTHKTMTLPIPTEKETFFGFHAICGFAYDDGIHIQNSWGSAWGYNGVAVLPYDYPIAECWGVIDRMKEWDIIELKVGATKATINGVEEELDAPAQIINSRTMVPLRFIAEALGCDVEWLEKERKVIVRKEKK